MKLKKIVLATVLTFGAGSMANAANQGGGSVTFTGSIIDAPCSIQPGDTNQSVNLGQISNTQLANGGSSTPENFEIKLQGCTTTTAKNVTTTFTGMEGENGLLGITGTAKGASIAITDGSGAVVKLNQPSKPQGLQNGNNTISFSAYLVGNGSGKQPRAGEDSNIVVGDFKSVANFTLAYQ
ncbi:MULTISPECIES: fimbrial protein [Serratia]|uniref:Fimbria A protein n=1 Tax=Serratia quinivorans TaxID=137545 RepID=A0A379ZY04_9GAMM|nr:MULTISPECIES: fimbrial protein [Serratia]RYM63269.1 fimbria A protein [Serratia proteamaculans]CAI1889483.1 Fimbria A protein precursor [Serratia quinivorans]SUI70115.1 Fimbria A protein precursor [Serratia quinivorans]